MIKKLTNLIHTTRSSVSLLAMAFLPPKPHAHPKKEGCNQADAYGDQYLWLQSQPRSFKEAAEDGCTNGYPHSSQIDPDAKEDDCRYSPCHEPRVSEDAERLRPGSHRSQLMLEGL
jgi:hypothetical protein